jgi:cytochrome P450
MDSTERGMEPKAPKGHWLTGNKKALQRDLIGFTAATAWEYGPVACINFVGRKLYITADADCVKEIFLTSTENYCKGRFNETIKLIAGNGLITSEGSFWKRQRRLAQPGFHREKMLGFMQTFIDCAYETSEQWETADSNKVVQLSSEMTGLTMRIVGKTLFSIDLAADAITVPPDVKALLRMLNLRNYSFPRLPFKWPVPSHIEFRKRKRSVDAVVYRIIDERIDGATNGNDILQLFLEARDEETGEGMLREEIHDEILTVFLAGYETSSVALCWIWYLLWQHPACHEKLRKEIGEVTGGGKVTPAHLMKLDYARQVVSEALRLYPPVFTIPRQVKTEHELKGYRLKKDHALLVSVYGLHRNPAYWEAPDEFRPERFAAENHERLVKNAYIPFGAGQRICIGQQFALLEMIAALAVLSAKFMPEPVKGYKPRMVPAITTNISEGMPVRIKSIGR